MKLRSYLGLIPKAFIFIIGGLITLQQLLVAAGTWALGEAGLMIAEGTGYAFYLLLFLGLSLAPQALTILIKKFEAGAYWVAYGGLLHDRLLSKARRPLLWQNQDRKDAFQTAIGPESESYLTAVLFSCFDIYKFTLTIVFNISALALVVDDLFPLVYAFAGLLSYLLFMHYATRIRERTEAEQESKLQFFAYLLSCWDNVFLNNAKIASDYQFKLCHLHEKTYDKMGDAVGTVETATLVLTLASHLPVFAFIGYLAMSQSGDAAALTALLVTIPRQMHVLTHFRYFFEQINSLIAFRSRLTHYWQSAELEEGPRGRVRPEMIRINGEQIATISDAVTWVRHRSAGRQVVSGANGSGKSTLLLHLNAELENSFYLPANPKLEIRLELGAESTGERILKHLDAALASGSRYLLLDEWDANLDRANAALVNARLDEVARDCVVVEVRH